MSFVPSWKLLLYYHLELILRKIVLFRYYLSSAQTNQTQKNENDGSYNTTFINCPRKARRAERRQIRAHAYSARRAVNRQPGFRSGDS